MASYGESSSRYLWQVTLAMKPTLPLCQAWASNESLIWASCTAMQFPMSTCWSLMVIINLCRTRTTNHYNSSLTKKVLTCPSVLQEFIDKWHKGLKGFFADAWTVAPTLSSSEHCSECLHRAKAPVGAVVINSMIWYAPYNIPSICNYKCMFSCNSICRRIDRTLDTTICGH